MNSKKTFTKKSDTMGNTARAILAERSDEELLDELDEVMAAAAQGDGRALAAIVIGFGPMLVETAKEALGIVHQQDAGDVIQELSVMFLEKRLVFPRIRGAAIPWMKRMVRVAAQSWLRKQKGPPGMAG